MPNQPISCLLNPLPQADYPENLYKRSQTKVMRTSSAEPSSDYRPGQETASIINRPSKSSEPPQPRPESSRPRQSSAIDQQQLAEAQAIAQRVHDTSGSSRLEFLLRRQQSNRYEHWQKHKPLMELEHLAIALRPDQRFQIVIQGTKQPFSRQIFETVEYCAEAAAELEQVFALGGMLEFLGTEGQEAIEAIVWAFVVRERVELELAEASVVGTQADAIART
jgi:hypothetical protein